MFRFYELMKQIGHTVTGEDIELTYFTTPELSDERSLVLIMDKDHLKHKENIQSRAWLVALPLADASLCEWMKENKISYTLTDQPKKDLIRLIEIFYPEKHVEPRIHPTAIIGQNTVIGKDCCIEPYVVIGDHCQIGSHVQIGAQCVIGSNVTIGEHSRLHSRVTIYNGCSIGKKVIIHTGTVIGSDGFGYHREEERYIKIPHAGTVVIEDEVEIGSLCAVDRGTLGTTRIGRGSKLDNLIQIAHNVQIGEQTVIAAQAGIAGSTVIGDQVTIAGQAGIVGHITIGNGVTIGAQAGVIGSIPDRTTVSGYPAREHQQALRREALIGKIPDILRRIEAIEKAISTKQNK